MKESILDVEDGRGQPENGTIAHHLRDASPSMRIMRLISERLRTSKNVSQNSAPQDAPIAKNPQPTSSPFANLMSEEVNQLHKHLEDHVDVPRKDQDNSNLKTPTNRQPAI